jgi:hypothetical protein
MKKLVPILVALIALFGLGGSAVAVTSVNTTSTPGASDPAATQQIVCAAGYSPTAAISSSAKRAVFSKYHIKKNQRSKYVIDQLVPASLGGTSDLTNLWPQTRSQASKKNGLEAAARTFVCTGQVDLAAAQSAFTSDWASSQTTLQSAADARKAQVVAYAKAMDDAAKAQAVAAYVAAQQEAARVAAEQAAAAAAAAQQQAEQQAQQQQASCPNGTYVNTAGNTVCSPFQSASGPPAGATAQCRDGSYSFSQSRSGTCSSHGGVAQWL